MPFLCLDQLASLMEHPEESCPAGPTFPLNTTVYNTLATARRFTIQAEARGAGGISSRCRWSSTLLPGV